MEAKRSKPVSQQPLAAAVVGRDGAAAYQLLGKVERGIHVMREVPWGAALAYTPTRGRTQQRFENTSRRDYRGTAAFTFSTPPGAVWVDRS
jgi:hypothetical protein